MKSTEAFPTVTDITFPQQLRFHNEAYRFSFYSPILNSSLNQVIEDE